MKFYTGIGSRSTPRDVLYQMSELSLYLSHTWVLRSGGADGADTAFEQGAISGNGERRIYLPWKNYNGHSSQLCDIPQKAFNVAMSVWNKTTNVPWYNLKQSVRLLMARNVLQVLGDDVFTPSAFVVCWTPDGCTSGAQRRKETGGTGQAIAIADKCGIPVFNLQSMDLQDVYDEIKSYDQSS